MDKIDIGGQALSNGIMLRSKNKASIARRENREIIEKSYFLKTVDNKMEKIPILRGFILIKSLLLTAMESIKEEEVKRSKNSFLDKAKVAIQMIIAIFVFLILLIYLPSIIAGFLGLIFKNSFVLNIIEAFLRFLLFILYLKILRKLPDIDILMRYHGAEHKIIHCYEKDGEWTVENIKKYPISHPRCGTQFTNYFFLVFSFICLFTVWQDLMSRLIYRTAILPIVLILSYEVFLIAQKGHIITDRLNLFFMKIQEETTVLEPTREMIEVGIRAIRPIIGEYRMTGKEVLEKFGEVDGYLILEDVLERTRSELKLNMPFELTKEQEERIKEIEKQYTSTPLQYILGHWNFYGREFNIRENVLIPRFDTENLIENILNHKKDYQKILDIGTGTGIIAITLALEIPSSSVIGIDISEDAINLAEENRNLHNVDNVEIRLGNLFEPVEGEKFDLICSNPPYINKEDMEKLDWKVKREPTLALYGGEDGLNYYREIIEKAPYYLEEDGVLAFEIGYDQGESVKTCLELEGFEDIEIYQDLQGFDRVVIAVYNNKKGKRN